MSNLSYPMWVTVPVVIWDENDFAGFTDRLEEIEKIKEQLMKEANLNDV